MVDLSPLQEQIKTIVFVNGNTYQQAADWLSTPEKRIPVGTVRVHCWVIRTIHKAAGHPLPDKRRHFVSR